MMFMELEPRQQTILRAIVIEYITAAEPVGSELLVQKYDLGVKSATVRNEMAEMLERGLLEQPHTSAGRIPSDLGYRYYVDRLIITKDPSENDQDRVRDATDDVEALHSMLRDTVRALSRVTHLLSVATTVSDTDLTVKTAVVSALGPSQALAVLVLSNGHVENKMIDCPLDLTLEDVGTANEKLSTAVVGKTIQSLIKAAPPSTGNLATNTLISKVWAYFTDVARDVTRGTLISEGEEFMFAQPEFQRDSGLLAELLKDLTDSDILYDAVTPGETFKTVTIGKENRADQLHRLSVVRHAFKVGDNQAGVIALVGPTRMNYDRSIPLVSFTANALSESLTRFFG